MIIVVDKPASGGNACVGESGTASAGALVSIIVGGKSSAADSSTSTGNESPGGGKVEEADVLGAKELVIVDGLSSASQI